MKQSLEKMEKRKPKQMTNDRKSDCSLMKIVQKQKFPKKQKSKGRFIVHSLPYKYTTGVTMLSNGITLRMA